MLYLIGLGLFDEKDISLNGLESIKKSDKVYLENYTSKLACSLADLSKLYGKELVPVERAFVENGSQILKEAQKGNVSLLIIGDVFSATTHTSLFLDAKEKGVEVRIIHNASVLTAVGVTGLSLYKFGKTTSISWHDSDVPNKVIHDNGKLHTLCLLDLTPKENKYMQAKHAVERLIEKGLDPKSKVVVCAQLGSSNQTIIYTEAENVEKLDKFPQCVIVPGEMHFMEEEVLELFRK
jgi:diphthine synthase